IFLKVFKERVVHRRPLLSSLPTVSILINPSHLDHVCTTWGHYHMKTFDGHFYQLPSTCNHVMAMQCNALEENFNIQMQRKVVDDIPTIDKIIMKIDGTVVEINRDGQSIEIDEKYKNQVCGLCGNFDGVSSDFVVDGKKSVCVCVCTTFCEGFLNSVAFADCLDVVNVTSFSHICMSDMCNAVNDSNEILCQTMSEYSRQCIHGGGQPQQWRNPDFCNVECPSNLVYLDCSSACPDSCTTPQASLTCDNHCHDACGCPAGTVYDDITDTGCIAQDQCACKHNNQVYQPGETYTVNCRTCECQSGQWSCVEENCPGSCSIGGGAHVNTFDEKAYTFHGDCTYVMTQTSNSLFTVLVELHKCSLTDSSTCLKSVTLYFNLFLYYSVWLTFDPSFSLYSNNNLYHSGLCGNFNDIMSDDFKVSSGLTEGTAAAFVNTLKTLATCPDITTRFEHPCSQGINKGTSYASYWCNKMGDPYGMFAPCHPVISPTGYIENCMYDTCSCDLSEDCMCAAISSYAYECSAAGIALDGKYTNCPEVTQVYSYNMTTCMRTCRSLSQTDYSCMVNHPTVDGCGCDVGMYLNDAGVCVSKGSCPCYDKDTIIAPGETYNKDTVCLAPMVYFNCSGVPPGTTGIECQKSCSTMDMNCISTGCMSGCKCPDGQVLDSHGNCINPSDCPCSHNGQLYYPGETLTVDCNTCQCSDRRFTCTSKVCDAACGIYGDGHYITFDDKRFNFNGECGYTLVQDYCNSDPANGTFRIITENVPCGTAGTTCSKTIKIFLREFLVVKGTTEVLPSQIRKMGTYLVANIQEGLVLMWDQKTSLFVKISPIFQGKICGLCGNFDGNSKNDFKTRNQETVTDVLEFGNSWKVSSTCPDAELINDPCSSNPYRAACVLSCISGGPWSIL
uniref:VWFD domain-containing protein n=1 Tax=Cynoglossus semilaevis TaxID=244447 RepID=A0A3P8VM97_CYNSE